MFDTHKTRMIGLLCGEETMTMLSRFHRIPERDGQTNGQNCDIDIARQYAGIKIKIDDG